MNKYNFEKVDVETLTSSQKPVANETTLLTIFKERVSVTKIIKPKWYEFWKKETQVEELEKPVVLTNQVFPNTSFHIEAFDDNYLTFEIKNMKLDYDFKDDVYKGCTVLIDVTNDPFVFNAGQVISLGYHALRFTLEDVEILDSNKFKVHMNGIKHKISLPQH